ncbi:hypothetical protein K4K61_005871 [Colletotrichum sp. SAR11_59]|nr:hypothetical protein K4K61_005871 [Colletotrichum sp. SAR11_59]
MGSLTGQTSSTPDMAPSPAALPSPEDDEADYLDQVLRLSTQTTEAAIDEELVAKATALGISTSGLTPENTAAGPESRASTVATQHVRTFSTASRDSASTTLTSHPSLNTAPFTAATADVPPNSLARKRSKSLTFSHYDKYLSQLDPNIHQPKIQKAPPPAVLDPSTHSLFSVSTRRSYFSMKEGIRKIRWKRRSALMESTICKAQFCYICGAIWDPSVGCPNFCNGDEELERRRMEEEAREAELEAEKAAQEAAAAAEAAEKVEAEKRTRGSPQFAKLDELMAEELERFRVYMRKTKWLMWTRQAEKKQATVDRYSDLIEKMKERHAKTAAHLEERQIEAEMDLRSTLDQSEKSVKIRLKHMEAYCDGLGRTQNSDLPPRVVTERDLRLLGQQYNVRDGMERLHQAKINVLRDRQAKRMEELLERQEQELEKLTDKKEQEIENLATDFAQEEDTLVRTFNDRKQRLQRRWLLAIEILRKELEEQTKDQYASLDLPVWPDDTETQDEILASLPDSPASED